MAKKEERNKLLRDEMLNHLNELKRSGLSRQNIAGQEILVSRNWCIGCEKSDEKRCGENQRLLYFLCEALFKML